MNVPQPKEKWQSIHDQSRRIAIVEVKGCNALVRNVQRRSLATHRWIALNDIIDDYTKVGYERTPKRPTTTEEPQQRDKPATDER